MNKWELTDSVRNEYGPRVQEILDLLDANAGEGDLQEFDLSDTGFNPYTLCKYLEELGYEKGPQDDNGWQLDFWIPFSKEGHTPIEVFGTGITFTLGIAEMDSDWKHKRAYEEESIATLCDEIRGILNEFGPTAI